MFRSSTRCERGSAHQSARRQRCQPAHGTGSSRHAPLAANRLAHQTGHRHQLQTHLEFCDDAATSGERPDRSGRTKLVRYCPGLSVDAAPGIDVDGPVDFEMLLGMATAQAEAVRADVGRLLLYTPVVHPDEFDVAISYLVRRLEEGASDENFMSAVFELDNEN